MKEGELSEGELLMPLGLPGNKQGVLALQVASGDQVIWDEVETRLGWHTFFEILIERLIEP